MLKRIRNEKGISMVMVVIAMVVVIGMAAMVFDFGNATARKSRLQNACDAAALAGANEWALNGEDGVVNEAQTIFTNNISHNMNESVGWTEDSGNKIYAQVTTDEDNRKVIVTAHETIDTFLASVIGMEAIDINTRAAAIFGAPKTVDMGLRPFGVDINDYSVFMKNFNEDDTTLRETSFDGMSGNFNLLDLEYSDPAGGTANLGNLILYGSSGTYSIHSDYADFDQDDYENSELADMNDVVYTETGISAAIYKDINEAIDNGIESFICPVVDYGLYDEDEDEYGEGLTGKDYLSIVNFVHVKLTPLGDKKNDPIMAEIISEHIVVNGEVNPSQVITGVYAIDLIE